MTHLQTKGGQGQDDVTELRKQLLNSKQQLSEVGNQLQVYEEQGRQQQVKFQHVREEMAYLQTQREQSLAEAVELRRLLSDAKQQGLDQVEQLS